MHRRAEHGDAGGAPSPRHPDIEEREIPAAPEAGSTQTTDCTESTEGWVGRAWDVAFCSVTLWCWSQAFPLLARVALIPDPRAPSWGNGSILILPASSCCRRVGSWCRIQGVLALGGTGCPTALSPCPCSSLRQHSPNPLLPQILFLPWPRFPPPLLICSRGSVCSIQGFSRDSWLAGVSMHLRGWLSFTNALCSGEVQWHCRNKRFCLPFLGIPCHLRPWQLRGC